VFAGSFIDRLQLAAVISPQSPRCFHTNNYSGFGNAEFSLTCNPSSPYDDNKAGASSN